MIKLIRLFMIVLVCLPCFAHDKTLSELIPATDLAQHAQKTDSWVLHFASLLNNEELQVLANTLYLSREFGTIDAKLRTQAIVLSQLSSHIYDQAMASSYDNAPEYLSLLLENFKVSSMLHQSLFYQWKGCTEYLDTLNGSKLEEAITSFQKSTVEAMAQYIKDHKENFDGMFINNEAILENSNNSINNIAHEYKKLIEARGKKNRNYQNDYIHLSIATNLAAEVIQVAQCLMQSTKSVFEHANTLQIIGSSLCNLYYSKLYKWMQEHNQQPMVLFNEQGFIEEQHRETLLPIVQ